MKKKIKIAKNFFYNKFLGVLIKRGKKTKAKRILDLALLKISKQMRISSNLILYQVFFKLNTFVEIKKIKFKRGSHLVPFYISFSRRTFLALKWILQAVKKDKKKISNVVKLSIEFYKILKDLPCESLKLKTLNNSQAFINKSNTHFRW